MISNYTTRIILVSIVILILLASFSAILAADDRINQVHHFGGDALFCDEERGCWMLNSQGELLWEVPQAIIAETLEAACASGQSDFIEVGLGTYGPVTIGISCYDGYEPTLKLIGYDEWGKLNTMTFSPSYEPVTAPPSREPVVEATQAIAPPPPPPPPPPPGPLPCPGDPTRFMPNCEPVFS